ncbi:hypothetical protein [Bacillus sp. WP8]|nr:hypothetical protein [Bacillus sp. WP8]
MMVNEEEVLNVIEEWLVDEERGFMCMEEEKECVMVWKLDWFLWRDKT